jgi:hypothetical protein
MLKMLLFRHFNCGEDFIIFSRIHSIDTLISGHKPFGVDHAYDDVQEHHLQGSLFKSPVVITFETKPTRDFRGFIKLISSIAFWQGR